MAKRASRRKTENEEKREAGRFYTRADAFSSPAFSEWLGLVPGMPTPNILEPFAGACHIPSVLSSKGLKATWHCYDIDPPPEKDRELPLHVEKRNTIARPVKGFDCIITNPPYLAKNSAKRRGLSFPKTSHDDLYKLCLERMLATTPYVAAIIPESFLTQGLFHSRLHSVVSLLGDFFDDTECPVCLAMFVPSKFKESEDFSVWRNDHLLGRMSTLQSAHPSSKKEHDWIFNESLGEIGLFCCDSPKGVKARFVMGDEIPSSEVKKTSRALTRIAGLPSGVATEELVDEANRILSSWREATEDVLLTSFKGMRADGLYRRRLDYASARKMLDLALERVSERRRG